MTSVVLSWPEEKVALLRVVRPEHHDALLLALFDTAAQKEGMAAFLDRRKPNFRGV